MILDRRSALKFLGLSSAAAAFAGALKAEGLQAAPNPSAGLPFALTTPVHIEEAALRVRNLDIMVAYYRDVLGLREIRKTEDGIVLGAGSEALLHLIHRPDANQESQRSAGLFHIAYLMPSREDLARWLVHAAMLRVYIDGFADHNVSEAIYLTDPEGNGIEVYSDRPRERWTWQGDLVTMGTEPLDIDDILRLADTSRDTYVSAPQSLRIGHIHLRVGEIAKARAFYQDRLGLASTRGDRPNAAFLASGGYHHHIAVNTWNSEGASLRDSRDTGLDWFSLRVMETSLHAEQKRRFAESGAVQAVDGGFETTDPWGTKVRLLAS